MTFRVKIAATARREIDHFLAYAAEYSDEWALEQSGRLDALLSLAVAANPYRYAFFRLTGPPQRACLFEAGRQTKFWIVFTVDDKDRTVRILRFWNGRRDPASLRGRR